MIIELNIEKLIELEITPNDFFILYCLFKKDIELLKKMVNPGYHTLRRLEYKGFIKYQSDSLDIIKWDKLTLRSKAINLFEVTNIEQMWFEFKLAYPIKDGLRPLHGNIKQCQERYLKIVKNNRDLHKQILSAIQRECDVRKEASYKKQFMPAWKLMPTYINQRGWELYLNDRDDDKAVEGENDYGTKLV